MVGHCSIFIKYHSEVSDIMGRFNIGSTDSEIFYNFDFGVKVDYFRFGIIQDKAVFDHPNPNIIDTALQSVLLRLGFLACHVHLRIIGEEHEVEVMADDYAFDLSSIT